MKCAHPRQLMRFLCCLSTVWLGMAVLLTAAEEPGALQLGPLQIAAGPWMVVDDRGLVTVSVRLLAPIDLTALAKVQPYINRAKVPAPMISRVIPVSEGTLAGQIVASWTLPPLTSGHVRLGADPRAPAVEVPVLPSPTEAVSIAIVGGSRWPTSTTLLGPQPAKDEVPMQEKNSISMVLLLGNAAIARVGTAGWETKIPIMCRLAPPRTGDQPDPLQVAILGRSDALGMDMTWGCLGLPSLLHGPEVAVDIASRTRAWNLLLDPMATWDLSLRAPRDRRDVSGLRIAVGMAHTLDVPCIISGGSPAGFISEPMITAQVGGLQVASGGVRYLSATPEGEGVRSLDHFTARSLDDYRVMVIDADADSLVMRLTSETNAEPAIGTPQKMPAELLRWRHDATAADSGPGRGDVVALSDAWREAHPTSDPGKKDLQKSPEKPSKVLPTTTDGGADPLLAWIPRRDLATGQWSLLELYTLAASTFEADHLLARRLVADPWFVGDEDALLRRLPDWLQRDALLRWMAEPDAPAHAWIRVAGSTADTHVVRALLAHVEQGGAHVILDVLVERLTAQAAGRIPVDEDPMLQSRLATAVFDAATLSPTPLRPIACELEKKFSPLAQKPVTRFLERVGRFRTAP